MWRGGSRDTKYSPPHKSRCPLLCRCNSQVSDDVMYASTISHIHSSAPRYCLMPDAHTTKAEHLNQNAGYNLRVLVAGCEDLGGPGAGPGLAGGAARPGRVKSPLVFLRPVLCSALLGDSSCGFHSAAPRHCPATLSCCRG